MQAVDTNVLLRILVDDPDNQKQCLSARQWAENVERVYISQVVQVELVWVLKGCYELAREKIIFLLEAIKKNGAFELQRLDSFTKAIHYYQTYTADFADCIILAEAEKAVTHPLATFDKKLAKLPHTTILL